MTPSQAKGVCRANFLTQPRRVQTPRGLAGAARIGPDLVSGTGKQRSQWAIEAVLTGIADTGRS